MAVSDSQMLKLETNFVSIPLLAECGLHDNYYMSPLMYIQDELHIHLSCTGAEYKHACEMAHDEDIAPHDASIETIVDGILAMVFRGYLEACGLNIVSYFTYRFHPPNAAFQAALDKFEEMVNLHKAGVQA